MHTVDFGLTTKIYAFPLLQIPTVCKTESFCMTLSAHICTSGGWLPLSHCSITTVEILNILLSIVCHF